MAKEQKKKDVKLKKEEIADVAKKMEESSKLTVTEERKLSFKIFINILIVGATMIYFYLIHLGYKNIEKDKFILDLKVFSCISLVAAIVLFEQSYKKESKKLCIHGIEMLIIAILTLFMPYVYFYSNLETKIVYLSIFVFALIYYGIKSILIHRKTKNKHLDDMSDVKEIVKK